jgi:hypothetical protein
MRNITTLKRFALPIDIEDRIEPKIDENGLEWIMNEYDIHSHCALDRAMDSTRLCDCERPVRRHRQRQLSRRGVGDEVVKIVCVSAFVRDGLQLIPERGIEGEEILVRLIVIPSISSQAGMDLWLTRAKRRAGISCCTTL